LVVVGVSTHTGVGSIARQAYEAGFNVTLAVEAMTDGSPKAHDYSLRNVFPRLGETGTTEEMLALLHHQRRPVGQRRQLRLSRPHFLLQSGRRDGRVARHGRHPVLRGGAADPKAPEGNDRIGLRHQTFGKLRLIARAQDCDRAFTPSPRQGDRGEIRLHLGGDVR